MRVIDVSYVSSLLSGGKLENFFFRRIKMQDIGRKCHVDVQKSTKHVKKKNEKKNV